MLWHTDTWCNELADKVVREALCDIKWGILLLIKSSTLGKYITETAQS